MITSPFPSSDDFAQRVVQLAHNHDYDFNADPNILSGAARFLLQAHAEKRLRLDTKWIGYLQSFDRFGHLNTDQLDRLKKGIASKKPFSYVSFTLDERKPTIQGNFSLFLFRYLQTKGIEAEGLSTAKLEALLGQSFVGRSFAWKDLIKGQSAYFGDLRSEAAHLARCTTFEVFAQHFNSADPNTSSALKLLAGRFVSDTLQDIILKRYLTTQDTYVHQMESELTFWKVHLIARFKDLPTLYDSEVDSLGIGQELPLILDAYKSQLARMEQGKDYMALLPFEQVAARILDNPKQAEIEQTLAQAQVQLDEANQQQLNQLMPSLISMLPLSVYAAFDQTHLNALYDHLWNSKPYWTFATVLAGSDILDACYQHNTPAEQQAQYEDKKQRLSESFSGNNAAQCLLFPSLLSPDETDTLSGHWRLRRLLEKALALPEGEARQHPDVFAHGFLDRMKQEAFREQILSYLQLEIDANDLSVNMLNPTFAPLNSCRGVADLSSQQKTILNTFSEYIRRVLKGLTEVDKIDQLQAAPLLTTYFQQQDNTQRLSFNDAPELVQKRPSPSGRSGRL